MFGLAFNPIVIAVVAGGLLVSHGAVAYKFYGYGADRQKVVCDIRVNTLQAKINAANAEIDKINKARDEEFEKLQDEVAASAAKADEAEALANSALGTYADEVNKRADKCLLTGDDAGRLR